MTKSLTTEEFIKKSKEKYGNKFDYSKTKYVNKQINIITICSNHIDTGEQLQTPKSHLTTGCRHCNREEKRKIIEIEFTGRAKLVHGNKYEYSKVKYIDMHDKVIIGCFDHGEFKQTPANHLKGQGCYDCGIQAQTDNNRYSKEEIDQYLIDNNRNIKRLTDYDVERLIQWMCLDCQFDWKTTFGSIKNSHSGCPRCNDTKLSNEIVDKRLIENNCNIRRVGEYVNQYTKIDFECLKCFEIWPAQPCEILRSPASKKGSGSGCSKCSRYKNERTVGEFLKTNNLNYSKLCIRLSDRKIFPDYFISDLNLIIEYNGAQHYKPICFGNMTEQDAIESFENQQQRDELLRQHCINNNIKLLEIDGRKFKGEHLRKFLKEYFVKEKVINYDERQ